jgi:hypothetical protein
MAESLGAADLKENPLTEVVKKTQDLSDVVAKELPPLEARARVSNAKNPRDFFFFFFFFFFFSSYFSGHSSRVWLVLGHQSISSMVLVCSAVCVVFENRVHFFFFFFFFFFFLFFSFAFISSLSQSGQLRTATEEMLALEKKTRQSGDSDSSVKVSEAIVQVTFDVKDFEALNSVLALLSKRRGQFKRVILRIVNMAIDFVERMPKPEQLKLIDTLRAITEGKIFVENERARLTRQLARMKEAEGDLKTASKLMQVRKKKNRGQSLLLFVVDELLFRNCKWRRTTRWIERKRRTTFWSKCACVWRQAILLVAKSSAARSANV